MYITDDVLGKCELEIHYDRFSSVDSYIMAGYSITLDRELTDSELDRLQDEYAGEIQWVSYSEGYSRNHNWKVDICRYF